MPETLLKKRKSQEKERADKAEEREQKKKVSLRNHPGLAMMMSNQMRLASAMMSHC